MGLFSSHHRQRADINTNHKNDHSLLYVLVRAQPTNGVTSSSQTHLAWSICVEQPQSRKNSNPPIQQHQPKKSKSLFNIKRQASTTSDESDTHTPTSPSSTSPNEYIEFQLDEGNLHISHPSSSIPTHSPLTSNSTDEVILLKILLPNLSSSTSTQTQSHSITPSYNNNLSSRIEQILHSTTSTNTHLTSHETKTWLRFSLISLQHANLLPPSPAFNVNDFIAFVENKFTEFEAETVASTHHEDHYPSQGDDVPIAHVRELDYQSHLDENARLRALFGHTVTTANGNGHGHSYAEHEHESDAHVKGGKSGWWVSRPQSTTNARGRSRAASPDSGVYDPYGGLM